MNIFVANLDFKISNDRLQQIFEDYGQVDSVKIITDKHSGRSKGFGFVEMPDDSQAKQAIESLNGAEIEGRPITVKEAIPKS